MSDSASEARESTDRDFRQEFIKKPGNYGEFRSAVKMPIEQHNTGQYSMLDKLLHAASIVYNI